MEYLRTKQDLTERDGIDRVIDGFKPQADVAVNSIRPIPWPVRRGEIDFHHSLTWHGSPTNRSPRRRRALAIRYITSEATHTGRPHPMSQFINVPVGGRMLDAGDHFPIVCRGGVP